MQVGGGFGRFNSFQGKQTFMTVLIRLPLQSFPELKHRKGKDLAPGDSTC